MFGNLKSKLGDSTDLKKLSSPQAITSIAGSRQRSSQHTPGSVTPRSRHSRQASTASLQGLGLPMSPPRSPSDLNELGNQHERTLELEREVLKLKSALESQQDAALERLNIKEQEWKNKLQGERDKVMAMEGDLTAAQNKEKQLQEQIDNLNKNKNDSSHQLKEAQARVKGLEAKIAEIQDNCDQMEGLNTQEMAKIKHMLLNTNSELENTKEALNRKTEDLKNAETRITSMSGLEERISILSEEKTDFESQVSGLTHKLNSLNNRYNSLEEAKKEEAEHLQERIKTLEMRKSQETLQETDKVQSLMKERETMEHRMEEVRQQLNNIKSSWSEKITALENQIQNLNSKTAVMDLP